MPTIAARTKVLPTRQLPPGQGAAPHDVLGASALRHRLGADRRLGLGLAVAASAALALVAAWQMPRGPVTTLQAVALVLVAFAVGLLGGAALRSRWALLAGPATFVAVYELAWLRIDGPMTDAPTFDSVMGLLVVVFGRGWLGVLALLPMALGAAYGLAVARRRWSRAGASEVRGRGGRIAVGLASAVVLALLAGLLRPTGTPAIQDATGGPRVGSVAELTTVELGGHEQGVLLRGADVANPVLLYLAGGPGGSDLGAMRLFGAGLEEDFVVATWDQRGTGTSYAALEPRATLTVDQAVADLLELTDYLRERFDEDEIYVLGNSWGTTLGVLAVQRSPERFAAFVGTGQMVSQRQTDVLMYEDLLARAIAAGDTAQVERLQALGPPPFDHIADYAPMLVQPSDRPETEWPANVLVREYSLVEQVNVLSALVETFATLYPQLQHIDLRRDVPRLEVPVYLVDGADEDPARADLAAEWLQRLDAPLKRSWVLADAGHRPHVQQPEQFADLMRTVLADTGRR